MGVAMKRQNHTDQPVLFDLLGDTAVIESFDKCAHDILHHDDQAYNL
jgi:hypothetical protein